MSRHLMPLTALSLILLSKQLIVVVVAYFFSRHGFEVETGCSYYFQQSFDLNSWGGSGGGCTTRPLPRDGGAEEFRGDPTVGPHPKVWTIDREKRERSQR